MSESPETVDVYLSDARCCACDGKLDSVNVVSLNKKPNWKHPTVSNVLTEDVERACAILCSDCVESGAEIKEAIEWDQNASEFIYHSLEDLEDLPPMKTYLLVGTQFLPGIRCLICEKISWNKNDVENRYCGNCNYFH